MSKVKNISGGALDVPLLDRLVEDGETVEVPDFQPGSTDENPLPVDWPPNRWKPVAAPSVKPESRSGAKSGTKPGADAPADAGSGPPADDAAAKVKE